VKGKSIRREDRIRLTIEDGIADVRLNRADKINALDPRCSV
jgi:enoyl-CoA hydratase/carnithine racemase